MIQVKRVYDPPAKKDGQRYLVDRLWPRGVKKDSLRLQGWVRPVSPTDKLRQWFHHDPVKWPEFRRRYAAELEEHPEAWQPLMDAARQGDITLVYGASDAEHNNAVVLKEFLDDHLR